MKTLALFDFDKTLYNKDSLLEFTKFSKGNFSYCLGLLTLSPILILLKLKMISNEKAKIKFITHFFNGMEYEKFNATCRDFSLNKIEKDLNKSIFAKFENHLQSGHEVYIVTASIPEWIEPWSRQFKVKVIGTKIELINNKLTGLFITNNCFGNQKVIRIKEAINLNEYDSIFAYGSGKGDFEMLKLSKNDHESGKNKNG